MNKIREYHSVNVQDQYFFSYIEIPKNMICKYGIQLVMNDINPLF